MWPVLAARSTTLTNLLQRSPPDQVQTTRTPHRVRSFITLRDIRRLIKQIVAVRPQANRHVNQPGNQTSKPSGAQPDQSPAQKTANNPHSRDKLAGQDQEQTTNTHAATLEFPISPVTEKPDESNAPSQQESPPSLKPVPPKSEQLKPEPPMDKRNPSTSQPPEQSKSKSKSTCGPSRYDLPLITSCG